MRPVAGLLLGLLVAAGAADAPFRFERAVIPGGPGPNRLAVDVPLIAGAGRLRYDAIPRTSGETQVWRGGLEDLRLFDRSGREVPYLLVAPGTPTERWETASLLPVAATKAASGFEAELKAPFRISRLRLEGLPAPFLKRFRLEGSGDRARWALLVSEGTFFDLPDERLRQIEISFPSGEFRYLRVTWDDRMSARLPLPRKVTVRRDDREAPLPPRMAPVSFLRVASEPGKSRFRLNLGAPHLPVLALQLVVAPGPLLREAKVTEARLEGGEVLPHPLGRSVLRQTTRQGMTASDLRIPIDSPEGPDLDLVVDDGDNPPLDLKDLEAVLAPLPTIWFEAATADLLVARFGNARLSSPRYDLEALRELAAQPAAEARWGEVREVSGAAPAAPASPLPEFGAAIETGAFYFRREILSVRPGLDAVPLDAAVLAHGSLASLRIADERGRQVPYLLEKRDGPLSLDLPAPERMPRVPAVPHVSAYRVLLPFAGLPPSRLVLTTTARVFERPVSVSVRREESVRADERVETVLQAVWRHTDPETPASPIVLDLPVLGASAVTLNIDEGDNSPLPISALRLLLPSYRLRFYATTTTGRTLLYGEPSLPAPRYDLSLLASRLVGVSASEVSLGPESMVARPGKGGTDRRIFWGVLVAAVVILLALLTRLLRSDAGPAPPAPSS